MVNWWFNLWSYVVEIVVSDGQMGVDVGCNGDWWSIECWLAMVAMIVGSRHIIDHIWIKWWTKIIGLRTKNERWGGEVVSCKGWIFSSNVAERIGHATLALRAQVSGKMRSNVRVTMNLNTWNYAFCPYISRIVEIVHVWCGVVCGQQLDWIWQCLMRWNAGLSASSQTRVYLFCAHF